MMIISAEIFIRLLVLVLYLSVGSIAFRWLLPRLSPPGKRLAILMLAAQALVIAVSQIIRPSSAIEDWLWNLGAEWNIPATLASTQLALIACVALATAWLGRARPAWKRLYLVGLALTFLFLAWDEYIIYHELLYLWQLKFGALGAAVVAVTLVVALRSPRRLWAWHICLAAGLAISALGALVLDLQQMCGNWVILRFDPCADLLLLEESLELLGIWLVLVGLLGQFSDVSPSPKPIVNRILYAFAPLWILMLIQSSSIHPIARQNYAQPAAVEFETGARLHSYRIESGTSSRSFHMFLSRPQWDTNDLGYSIHLVDQVSGESIAYNDKVMSRHLEYLIAPGLLPTFRNWMRVDRPSDAPPNRALWILLTFWQDREGEYVGQKVLSSDLRLMSDTQVVLGELVLPAQPSPVSPSVAALATFDNGFALVAAEGPERARAAEILRYKFSWRSIAPGREDYVQFLHLGHEASGEWWVYDQQPLGPRLPTRLWYAGLADSETWHFPLPADLAPGRYAVFSGLYRSSDKERVLAQSADGNYFLDARVPLGSLVVK